MKRPQPFDDDARASRRRGGLSAEDRALWTSVAERIKPLRKKPPAVKVAEPGPERPSVSKRGSVADPAPSAAVVRSKRDAPDVAPRPVPIGRRERSQLSRGRKEIDARIDLHGLSQAGAHRALLAFLRRASHDGMTFVLVITGKGRATGDQRERGILRRVVPLWFTLPEFRALVVGYDEAGIGHGGEGALYVRLRRARA